MDYSVLLQVRSRKEGTWSVGLFTRENGFDLGGVTYEVNPVKIMVLSVNTNLAVSEIFTFCEVNKLQVLGIRDDTNHLTSYKDETGRLITM